MGTTKTVNELVNDYFDLMYTCDTEKFDEVFHQNAQLQSVGTAGYTCWPAAQYKEILKGRLSPASQKAPRDDRIVSIDQSSDVSALAKVKVTINGVRYCDYLSLLNVEGKWRVVGKVFCVTAD